MFARMSCSDTTAEKRSVGLSCANPEAAEADIPVPAERSDEPSLQGRRGRALYTGAGAFRRRAALGGGGPARSRDHPPEAGIAGPDRPQDGRSLPDDLADRPGADRGQLVP